MTALLIAVIAVALLNVYAAVLIVLRARVYGVTLYRPMLLNIGLSFLPVLLAIGFVVGFLLLTPVIGRVAQAVEGFGVGAVWGYVVVATMVWVLFFPNSVYLITELNFSHRGDTTPVPLWYDIVQTLALTLSGIANAVLSLAVVQTMVVILIDRPDQQIPSASWVFAAVVIVLGAVGVYLGRYLRLNSWDVRHPASMFRKLGAHLRQRGKALEAFGFVLTHALLIGILYVPLYALGWAALVAGVV